MNDQPAEQALLTWETRIRVLTNPNIWSSMLMVIGIPSVLLGIMVAFVSQSAEYALIVPLGAMAIIFAIFVVVALAIDLFGGFKATFILTPRGVHSLAGKGAKTASTAALMAGVLAGNAGVAGAGLLAKSEQDVFIAWQDVKKIKLRGRHVLIKGAWGDKPIGLYCTAENFSQVQDILGRYAGQVLAPQRDTLHAATP